MNAKQVGGRTIGVDAQHAACTPRRSGAVPADGDMDAEEALGDLRARAWTSVATQASRARPDLVGRTPASITSWPNGCSATPDRRRAASRQSGGGGRNRTGLDGFAIRCITSLPPRRARRGAAIVCGRVARTPAVAGGGPRKQKGKPWLPRSDGVERETRLELATSTLARLRSTN